MDYQTTIVGIFTHYWKPTRCTVREHNPLEFFKDYFHGLMVVSIGLEPMTPWASTRHSTN